MTTPATAVAKARPWRAARAGGSRRPGRHAGRAARGGGGSAPAGAEGGLRPRPRLHDRPAAGARGSRRQASRPGAGRTLACHPGRPCRGTTRREDARRPQERRAVTARRPGPSCSCSPACNAVLVVAVVLAIVALAAAAATRRGAAPTRGAGRPLRRGAAPGRSCAARSRSGRGRPAPRPRGAWPSGWRRALPNGRFEPLGPAHPRLRNVVGVLPGARPAIVVAAHYDTKAMPGLRRRQRRRGRHRGGGRDRPRAAPPRPRPAGAPELRFVLFDGEESPDDRRPFERAGLRGSRAYARARGRRGGGADPAGLRGRAAACAIRREANSDAAPVGRAAPGRGARVGAAAAFPPGTGAGITDDHVPFLRRGVPAINLIEWPYRCWHQPCDDLSAVSRALAGPDG